MPPEDKNKKELHQVGLGGIKSLRTYQSDIADALGKNNMNVAKIAIAENVRKAEQESTLPEITPKEAVRSPEIAPVQKPVPMTIKPPVQVIGNKPEVTHSSNNIIMFFLSILLLAGGVFGGLYFYKKSPLASPNMVIEPNTALRGLLVSNGQKKVYLGTLINKRLEEVLAYERTQIKEDGIKELYFTKGSTEKEILITSEEFLTLSTTRSPETVRRSLLDRFMFGFKKTDTSVEPFIILKTNFFQNTFTGMLKWEPEMYTDTKAWLSRETSVADHFEDKVIKNKDVRILKDVEGKVVILYSFIDKETLVITTNEATFFEILDRFEKQTYVR